MTTLFRQKLRCPECSTEFYTNMLGSYGTVGAYTDLCPIYSGVPALFSFLASCPMCGFTAYMDRFEEVPPGEDMGAGQWDEKEESEKPWGPARFLKAVETYRKLNASRAVIADLYLKAFWCFHYGDFEDADKRDILGQTIFHFQEALEEKDFPESQENEYIYLLGELSRRLGRFAESIEWFGKMDTSTTKKDLLVLADRMKKLALKKDASDQTV